MNRPGQFGVKRGMDPALALHPRKAFKGGANHADVEMGFARRTIGAGGAGMTSMAGAFVHHFQPFGRKGGGQFFADGVCHFHGLKFPRAG